MFAALSRAGISPRCPRSRYGVECRRRRRRCRLIGLQQGRASERAFNINSVMVRECALYVCACVCVWVYMMMIGVDHI